MVDTASLGRRDEDEDEDAWSFGGEDARLLDFLLDWPDDDDEDGDETLDAVRVTTDRLDIRRVGVSYSDSPSCGCR